MDLRSSQNPWSLSSPKAENFECLFLHSVFSGGGGMICERGLGGQSWEDYGF